MRKPEPFEIGVIFAARIVNELDGDVIAFELLKEIGADDIDPRHLDALERPILRAYQRDYASRQKREFLPAN